MSYKDNPSQGAAGLFLLLIDFLLYPGFDRMKHLPPLAIFLALFMVLLYFRVIYPGYDDPWDMCVSADRVVDDGDYACLFMSSFEHAGFLHLFCNMASFIWTAACLEHQLHPLYFLYMLVAFAWMCNLVEIGIAEITTKYFHDPMARYACAIGFSDVLFALKILLVCYPATHQKWSEGYILKYLPYPSLSLVTLEFALLHLFVPEASLQSHLAGVLVGLLYVSGVLSWPLNALWDKMTLGWGKCCGHMQDPMAYMLGMKLDECGRLVKATHKEEQCCEIMKPAGPRRDIWDTTSGESESEEEEIKAKNKKRSKKKSTSKARKKKNTFTLPPPPKKGILKNAHEEPYLKLMPPPVPHFPPPDNRRRTPSARGGIRPSVLPMTDLRGVSSSMFNRKPKSTDSDELLQDLSSVNTHKRSARGDSIRAPRSRYAKVLNSVKSSLPFKRTPQAVSKSLNMVKSVLNIG